jgi:hypothetical protein
MNEIETVGSFSGLLLNRNKTEGVWIGKLKKCKYKIASLAKNVNRGKITDLMIKIFPNMERFLFPHAQNSLFIFSILFSQMLEFKWWRSNKFTCHIHRYQKTLLLKIKLWFFENWIKSALIYVNDILDSTKI